MNPKQKRTWGTGLRVFGLILVLVDAGLVIVFRWRPGARFATVAILIASLAPLWCGTVMIWQARKEEDRK